MPHPCPHLANDLIPSRLLCAATRAIRAYTTSSRCPRSMSAPGDSISGVSAIGQPAPRAAVAVCSIVSPHARRMARVGDHLGYTPWQSSFIYILCSACSAGGQAALLDAREEQATPATDTLLCRATLPGTLVARSLAVLSAHLPPAGCTVAPQTTLDRLPRSARCRCRRRPLQPPAQATRYGTLRSIAARVQIEALRDWTGAEIEMETIY